MNRELSRAQRSILNLTAERQAAEAAVSLEATLLGDGRDTPEYAKRLELRDRLIASPFVAHVSIPEVLHDQYPDAALDDVERSAIEEADIVLCIESPARVPLGLYTEVWSYFDRSIPDKWYRLRPLERPTRPEERALIAGLVAPLLKQIETADYDPATWRDCGRITALCLERIELIAQRRLDQQSAD